jgi:sortase A
MTLQIHLRKSSPAVFRRTLSWSTSALLFLVGISTLGYCAYVALDARFFQNAQSRQFDQALNDVRSAAEDNHGVHATGVGNDGATSSLMPVFAGAGRATPTTSSPIAPDSVPLGRIEIAAIGLTSMIQEGTAPRTLQRGVGHIQGTSLPGQSGNVGLAGHRDTFFRKLRIIHVGDEIRVSTLTGVFWYRVDLISIVEPQDSQVLRDSGGDFLTLVTCYPFGFIGPAPKRFVVRARNVSPARTPETAMN